MDRMDKVLKTLTEVNQEIKKAEKEAKPRVITEVIKGSFPKRLGMWHIEKHPNDIRASKTGFLAVYLPTSRNGCLIEELRSEKHEVLFTPLREYWGEQRTESGRIYRLESRQIPFCGTCHPGTWAELFEYGLNEVQKISDILVEVSRINEIELQKTL